MKKSASIFILIFSMILFYSCGDKGSPASPEKPLKRAYMKINVKNLPLYFIYSIPFDSYCCYFDIIISEHFGVGVNIATVKTEMLERYKVVASNTAEGGRLPPNGSLEVQFYIVCSAQYDPDIMIITVTGRDDNGHQVSASMNLTASSDISFKFN